MIRLFSFLVFCLSANMTQAQTVENEVSQVEFEELSEKINFDKTRNALRPRKKAKPKTQTNPNPSLNVFNGIGQLFNLVAYVLIGALVIFVVYLIFSNFRMKTMIPNSAEIEENNLDEIKDIKKIDLDSLYDQALSTGDYRLALRIRYLKILQFLSLQNLIEWKFDKTNRDYCNELKGTHHFDSFRKLSNIFEWVWYGNKEIDQSIFNSCQKEFDTFKIQRA